MLYGYYANKAIEECQRILNKNFTSFKHQFLIVTEDFMEIVDDMSKEWDVLATQLAIEIPKRASERFY